MHIYAKGHQKQGAAQQTHRAEASLNRQKHPAALIQRTRINPTSLSPREVLHLQRTVGNRAVRQFLVGSSQGHTAASTFKPTIQAKLTIGPANDRYEQEADRVASHVSREISTSAYQPIQREREREEEEALQMIPHASTIQRQNQDEEEELMMKPEAEVGRRRNIDEEELKMKSTIQRRPANSGVAAPSDVEAAIQQSRGSGQALPKNVRRPMEQKLGADFSGVKVHTDAKSDQLNRSVSARAFTTGRDIFFKQGAFDPSSSEGRSLLAHELTHVVQQNRGNLSAPASSSHQVYRKRLTTENVLQKKNGKGGKKKKSRRSRRQRQLNETYSNIVSQIRTLDTALSAICEHYEPISKLDLPGKAFEKTKADVAKAGFVVHSMLMDLLREAALIEMEQERSIPNRLNDLQAIKQALRDNLPQQLIRHAKSVAFIAVASKIPDQAKGIMAQADIVYQAFAEQEESEDIEDLRSARGRRRDTAHTVVDVADIINNFFGTGSGIAGGIENIGGVAGAGGGAAVGGIGGALGLLFGAIGTGFGIYAFAKGAIKRKAIKKISPAISNQDLDEIIEYAKEQKWKKKFRGGFLAGLGVLGITAGILSIIAINVASFGIPAVIFGLTAAVLGLSVVAWKIFHRSGKRETKRWHFAQTMVDEIRNHGDRANEFSENIRGLGLNPTDVGTAEEQLLVFNLAQQVGDLVKSKRKETAESIINFMLYGSPSEQFDAELIVKTLGRNPDKIRQRAAEGDYNTAVSRLESKLASW